ncbi:hypothetical protein [Dictyobacter kobayashii]|nr:hypothetical protein [Dictyobacter kobayashii]
MIEAFLLCTRQAGAIGRSYNIAGSLPVTVHTLAQTIAHAQHLTLPRKSIPLWLARLAAATFALLPGIGGSEKAPLTHSRIDFLTHSRIYDISRAQRELGFIPTTALDVGIHQTTAWYQAHAYL